MLWRKSTTSPPSSPSGEKRRPSRRPARGSVTNSSTLTTQPTTTTTTTNTTTTAKPAQEESPLDPPATELTESIKDQIVQSVRGGDSKKVAALLRECPHAASVPYAAHPNKPNSQETLLSVALLNQAPLTLVQAVYGAFPSAITQGNKHGMSALHQAATVPTPLDVMLFLVTSLRNGFGVAVGQLSAPGNWSVLHICCRCGVLPLDTFEYLLKQARTTLALKTDDKGSTPLHLAIFGLSGRTPQEQRFVLQKLIQAYPYAVNTPNVAGYTPVELAQHQAQKNHLPNDMVGLLLDVQGLVRRKYGTRVHVEQAIETCQKKLDAAAVPTTRKGDPSNSGGGGGSFNSNSSGGSGSGSGSNERGHYRRSSADKQAELRQGMLAHIEMQMLLPLRKKFPSEQELQDAIDEKTKERTRLSQMGPQYLAQTIALNEELIQLEAKMQREVEALVPREIQATRLALFERLQADTHLLPINNVSLQFLERCTDNFSEANRIGKGGFGSVYRAYDPAKCAQYAVKKTEKYDDPSLLREVEVLAHVFHPNVINLLGFYVPPEGRAPEYLVYEYAAGGTIADRVSSEENRKSLTWSIRLAAAVGVASGLNYLHHGFSEHKIYHHDVKPENIVFSETLDRAILIDCGISKVLNGHQAASFKRTMAGTPFYLPDDYDEETPYDEGCEVFSFGMVLRVLISGKMPKSLSDRTSQLEADPLAGTWPPGVLEKFMAQTMDCVAPSVCLSPLRPSVEQLYNDLMELEAEVEKKVELTEKQQDTINETLAESRQMSRASRNLQAFGQCYCSRSKKKGLYCPGRKHFQCSECFNKYVLDYLGEEIYCREACSCRDAYTLDELHHHLRRSILCKHVESLMRNRELSAYKSANGRIMDEIGRGFDRVMVGVTHLARNELQCPLLAVLIPSRSDGRRSVMRRALRSWKTSTTKTFFLYFLCAHDRSLVHAPIRVDATRDWVKAATPFLRAVLAGLQVAVMAVGLPINIPMLEMERRDDDITENLNVLDQMLVDVSGGGMDRDMQGVLNAMQGSAGQQQKLNSESYRLVAELANQPENTAWRERMVLSERKGELAWVRVENEARWKQNNSAAQN